MEKVVRREGYKYAGLVAYLSFILGQTATEIKKVVV